MENIYITWHYTTHGVAYLKHILSKFYLLEELPSKIYYDQLDQEELNLTFDIPAKNSFVFDKIIYLTAPQEAFDKLSSRRFAFKETILADNLIINQGLKDLFKEVLLDDNLCDNLEATFDYVKANYTEKVQLFEQAIWRNIHHYPIKEQVKWLTEYSNFKNVYKGKFNVEELNVDDLRNEEQISYEVNRWSLKYFSEQKNFQPVINVSLGSNETQVVWHILSEANQLPENTRFIKTYDDKTDKPEKRFKKFSIQEISTNLISSIKDNFPKIYPETESDERKLVDKKMTTFLQSGFSILLIGERGIGKSKIASKAKETLEKLKKRLNGQLIEANCASFDEDSKAEAELFGYKKGAFTGATEDKKGLLEAANGGILFLDEIHHLSKLVQAKLMKALQTNKHNKMLVRKMGNNEEVEIECRMIFATHKNIAELRNELLPDFYDRIVQHVVNMPPLRETVEDRLTDWTTVWEELRFRGNPPVPKESDLVDWLKQLRLYGNYRDLQKIAMYYNTFNQFDESIKEVLDEKTAFQYAKSEFEQYHSPVARNKEEQYNFDIEKTTKEMIADYLFELQAWAVSKFGGRKLAIEHFKSIKDTVTEKTFNDWKNKKSINKDSESKTE